MSTNPDLPVRVIATGLSFGILLDAADGLPLHHDEREAAAGGLVNLLTGLAVDARMHLLPGSRLRCGGRRHEGIGVHGCAVATPGLEASRAI